MKKPKYFTLFELLTSSTARQKSIENLPSWEIVEHLNELALFLDDIREAWGSGIHVNSAYRCEKLNSCLKGSSPTSVHKIGYAADIVPSNGQFEKFGEFLKNYLKNKAFDQLLIEQSGKSRWYHIGLYNNAGQQRRQIKYIAA